MEWQDTTIMNSRRQFINEQLAMNFLSPIIISLVFTFFYNAELYSQDTSKQVIEEEVLIGSPNNVFSPVKDGSVYFSPLSNNMEIIGSYHLIIFNRWGEIIFESSDPKVGWNGIFKEKLVQDGVYVWQVSYENEAGEEKKVNGHITVLK